MLRSSKENSPREIQDEGTTMVRNVGNCSTTDTASRPKEPPSYFHCMALFLFPNNDFFGFLCAAFLVSLDVLDLQQLYLWCFVSQIH